MIDLVGFTAIFLLIFFTLILMLKFPDISKILFIALNIRIFFLMINNFFFYLPDGDMDGLTFDKFASIWAQEGFSNVIKYYDGPDTYFLSFLIAIPYSLLGRSFLMAQSFSIFFSIATVFLSWLVTKKLWNDKVALNVAWTTALFPSLILYSVLIMREAYITFFLLLAIYGIVNWTRSQDYKSIILIIFGFMGATFFHGAYVVGMMTFLLIILTHNVKKTFYLIIKKKINTKVISITFLLIFCIYYYISKNLSFPYIGTFQEIFTTDIVIDSINSRIRGDSAYSEWTKINSNTEIFYKVPIRIMNFLFSPFPWEITKPVHLLGLLDSLLVLALVYLILKNIKNIYRDPALKIILIILVSLIFVFAVGVGNFGTGIRHRSKLIIWMILLAAPLIPKLILKKKIKIKI